MRLLKKLLAKAINNILKDEEVTVGTIRVLHKETVKADTIQEQTTNAGVQITNPRPNSGTESPDQFPAAADSKVGQIWYATDTYKLYVFLGIGQPGCNAKGWFNLKNAQYAS